jgi:hypothetical protein
MVLPLAIFISCVRMLHLEKKPASLVNLDQSNDVSCDKRSSLSLSLIDTRKEVLYDWSLNRTVEVKFMVIG